MGTTSITVTVEQTLLAQIDRLVDEHVFQSRTEAIEAALAEQVRRHRRRRLGEESAKLNPVEEQALADEGWVKDIDAWPKY